MDSITNSFNKLGLITLSVIVVACTNPFEPNRPAPLYGSVGDKIGQPQTPSTTIQQTRTTSSETVVRPSANTAQNQTQTTSVAIEKKTPASTVSSSVDPYANPYPTNTQQVVTQTTAVSAIENSNVAGTAINANAQTIATNAATVAESDPRFKSGEEVLNQSSEAAIATASNVTESTSATVDGAETVATAAQSVTTKATETVNSNTQQAAEEATTTVEETATVSSTTTSNGQTTTGAVVENDIEKTTETETVAKAEPQRPQNAAQALIMEARDAVQAGNYEKAASSLERAHSIEPRNAKILYDISQIRYAQGKYVQAESFASKAAGLSTNNSLSKKIWSLLANTRKALGNQTGAKLAQQKANSF